MRLSEGNLFKTCGNPHARDAKINRANVYENEMVLTYRDLNCSGASPKVRNVSLIHSGGRGPNLVVSLISLLLVPRIGRHLVGVWIGGAWNGHFQSLKNIFQRPKFPGNP